MTPRESAAFGATSKSVTGLAIAFLVVAAFFGFLNSQKAKVLRANAANAQAVRDAAERREAQQKQNARSGLTAGTEQQSKLSEAENRAAKAEAELTQAQKEKTDLQAKLDANQQEIASLQKRVEDPTRNSQLPSRRCAWHRARIQSGLQLRGVKSRCSQWSRDRLRNACSAGRDADWKNSHFFS